MPSRALPFTVPLALLLACGGDAATEARASDSGAGPRGTLLVSAASSLTDVFTDVAAAFEADHPGVEVILNLGGSSALRAQLLAGAPADVFAAADRTLLEDIASTHLRGATRVFARNELVIVVPSGNPAGIAGVEAFTDPALRVGLCAAPVPCGSLARRAFAAAGVEPLQDTDEPSARALLTKVALGELDAGVVWATDVGAAPDEVRALPLPGASELRSDYPIATVTGGPNPDGADAFVDFVLSIRGREILRRHGFILP